MYRYTIYKMSWTCPGHYKVHVHGWDSPGRPVHGHCPVPLPALAGGSRLTLLRKKLRNRGADHLKKEATKIPHITTESNKIQARRLVLEKFEGVDWPEHFFLEPVQERLEKCDFSLSPSKEYLVDVMIMLSMRPADVAGLCIDRYEASDEIWYNPDYSWYCTGYSKTKKTGVGEPGLFSQWKRIQYEQKSFLLESRKQYQKN